MLTTSSELTQSVVCQPSKKPKRIPELIRQNESCFHLMRFSLELGLIPVSVLMYQFQFFYDQPFSNENLYYQNKEKERGIQKKRKILAKCIKKS